MPRRFATLDVFTHEPMAGNPLAVVLDCDGLDRAAMQAIAREFNLPETVFVRAVTGADRRAAIRIFTPVRELPFASHPTLGTAVLLALEESGGQAGTRTVELVEELGLVRCTVELQDERRGRARFLAPRLPAGLGRGCSEADCARALSLDASDIGFDSHRPRRLESSTAYDLVPVVSIAALARAEPRPDAFAEVFGDSSHPAAFLYARVVGASAHAFRARMFWPGPAGHLAEDPATASAATTLAGALVQSESLSDGTHEVIVEQGVEMGRPSKIVLCLTVRDRVLVAVEIVGEAVVISRGELLL